MNAPTAAENHGGVTENELQRMGMPSPKAPADADLPRALGHAESDHAVYSRRGQDETAQSEDQEERSERAVRRQFSRAFPVSGQHMHDATHARAEEQPGTELHAVSEIRFRYSSFNPRPTSASSRT